MQRQVSGLGTIKGLSPDSCEHVEQYRGIPFGSVEQRFRRARLVGSWPEGIRDGTKFGYVSPSAEHSKYAKYVVNYRPISPFPKLVIGHSLTQARLTPQHDYTMDEFKCLNLNVTCPKGSTPESMLPVMVWIHG